jgi:hypothetical protein
VQLLQLLHCNNNLRLYSAVELFYSPSSYSAGAGKGLFPTTLSACTVLRFTASGQTTTSAHRIRPTHRTAAEYGAISSIFNSYISVILSFDRFITIALQTAELYGYGSGSSWTWLWWRRLL